MCSVKIAVQKDVDHEEQSLQLKEELRQARDDVTGNELDPKMVLAARFKEMEYVIDWISMMCGRPNSFAEL